MSLCSSDSKTVIAPFVGNFAVMYPKVLYQKDLHISMFTKATPGFWVVWDIIGVSTSSHFIYRLSFRTLPLFYIAASIEFPSSR